MTGVISGGDNMSDEFKDLSATADGAIRLWLVAVGSMLVVVGGSMIAEKDGARAAIGIGLVLLALPVHLSWVFWKTTKARLKSIGALGGINEIATSPKWWFGILFVVLLALIFTPIVQTPRWPSWPFSKVELSTISHYFASPI